MQLRLALLFTVLSSSALAQPVSLVCSVSISAQGVTTEPSLSGARLDLEGRRFVVPSLQRTLPIVKVNEAMLWFETDTNEAYITGTLDRLSGKISVVSMTPEEKRKMYAGQSSRLDWSMAGRCAPGGQLF